MYTYNNGEQVWYGIQKVETDSFFSFLMQEGGLGHGNKN